MYYDRMYGSPRNTCIEVLSGAYAVRLSFVRTPLVLDTPRYMNTAQCHWDFRSRIAYCQLEILDVCRLGALEIVDQTPQPWIQG